LKGMTLREQIANHCVHFTGTQQLKCKAAVNYRALVGGPDFGWATRLPCLRGGFWEEKAKEQGGFVACESQRFPSTEEVEAEAAESEERLRAFMARLAAGECPTCKKPVQMRQVGHCVYGDCGHRLYQGKLPKKARS